jgi:hypothetical protein
MTEQIDAQEQMKGVKSEDLIKLMGLRTTRAESLGYPVRFCPSDDFEEILQDEGFDEVRRPHIDGLICMDVKDYERGIYIREDTDLAFQLCALIHETLHAEMPHWDEPTVHTSTWMEMERIRKDPAAAIEMMDEFARQHPIKPPLKKPPLKKRAKS